VWYTHHPTRYAGQLGRENKNEHDSETLSNKVSLDYQPRDQLWRGQYMEDVLSDYQDLKHLVEEEYLATGSQ
jgi:hypothetical protein